MPDHHRKKRSGLSWGKTVLLLFAEVVFVLASEVSWGFLFSDGWLPSHPDASGFVTQGHWALSPQIEMGFDLAWHQGVHQLWGLGVALWYLPFMVLGRLFGVLCGYHPLLVALFCSAFTP